MSPDQARDSRDSARAPAQSRRRVAFAALAIAVAIGGLYLLLPAVAGLDETWDRLRKGDPWWLALAAALEVCSFGSYIAFFRSAFGSGSSIGWGDS